jgi:hypothetical protein
LKTKQSNMTDILDLLYVLYLKWFAQELMIRKSSHNLYRRMLLL